MQNEAGNKTRMDNRQSMADRATRSLLGKHDEGERIYQTISASNGRRSDEGAVSGLRESWDKQSFLQRLEKEAQKNSTWVDDLSSIVNPDKPLLGGFENEPYLSKDGQSIIKANNLNFLNDNDNEHERIRDFNYFLDRLHTHNETLGANVPYEIVGFGKNSKDEISVILKQPYVKDAHPASLKDVYIFLRDNGFRPSDNLGYGGKGFTNGKIEISDIKPENVLQDKNRTLYFIDADINSSNGPFKERNIFYGDDTGDMLHEPQNKFKSQEDL